MSDVRAAAERLVKFEKDCNFYGWPDRFDRGLFLEALTFVSIYLAEHPADDGETITREWFRSVSPTSNNWIHGDGVDIYQDSLGAVSLCLVEECQVLPHIKTRGDVRRLCRSLGVEVRNDRRPRLGGGVD